MDLDPDFQARATRLLRAQADYLLRVAGEDGSYREEYLVPSGSPEGRRDMTSQAFAIRALLAAYAATQDERYHSGARRTSATWNTEFWDSSAWLYRNEPGQDAVAYSPRDVAAALGALRELVLVDRDVELLERFKRFFVQAVDVSGLMQSEDRYTGEDLERVRAGVADTDGDGIPFLSKGDGRHGVDSVFASRVEFDLSVPREHVAAPLTKRMAASSGAEVYETNCAICHGAGGVGNEGPMLIANSFVQLTGREGVVQTVTTGRTGVGMPAWGGVLSDGEIGMVVDFIRSLKTTPGNDESDVTAR